MAVYEYDAYQNAKELPLVRIARKGQKSAGQGVGNGIRRSWLAETESTRVLELHLLWEWSEPVELALEGDLVVAVLPHHRPVGAQPGPRYGLVSWGRCHAFIRRWGATMPVDMLDPRVLAGLTAREEMEKLAWLVGGR